MKNRKAVIKKIVLIAVCLLVTLLGTGVYRYASSFIPKKTDIPVDKIHSSDSRSSIFVHPDIDGTGDGFTELIHLMKTEGFDFYNIIASDDVVILKINSQWDQRGGTNVDLTESVIKAILDHPEGFNGEIIIADNGQGQFGTKNNGGSMDWEKPNSDDKNRSMLDMTKEYSSRGFMISTYSWDRITSKRVDDFDSGDDIEGFVLADRPDKDTKITVSYPKFISGFGTAVSFREGIWDAEHQLFDSEKLKIINMPVLKTHMIYGVTGAVKSYMGVPSDKLTKNSHSTIGIGSMGTLMAETRMPIINIMDAVYINANTGRSRRGPSTDYADATFAKTVLISTDPVALDYYAAGKVLYPAVRESGFELKSMHQRDSLKAGSFGYWLRLSMKQLQEAGHEVVMDDNKTDIYVVNRE